MAVKKFKLLGKKKEGKDPFDEFMEGEKEKVLGENKRQSPDLVVETPKTSKKSTRMNIRKSETGNEVASQYTKSPKSPKRVKVNMGEAKR